MVGCEGTCGSVDEEAVRCSMVSVTKAPIWGQTRGCLEEQRMTAIDSDGRDDMAIRWG